MLENLKNALRKAFGLKAKPPAPEVPKEIVNNKYVRKAVNKSQRGRFLKRLALIFGASAALSTGLQYTPDLVSTKLDDFMAARGYADDYSKNFHTQEIRVYDRFNPLYPFHLAGRATQMTWHEELKQQHAGLISLALATPIFYSSTLLHGFTSMITAQNLDAYSIAPNDALDQRVNFIRPPGEFSLNAFMRDFSGVNGAKLSFQSDREELRNVLFQFVMLHEARHGDQEKLAFMTANESDADLYAFKVLSARGVDKQLLSEAATIVAHARAINATVGGDAGHATTFTLMRGNQRIFDAHQDQASFQRLHELLAEADEMNDKSFPATMPVGNRYFYLTLEMHKEGLLDEDPGMKKAAAAFIASIRYFDGLSQGKVIDRSFDTSKINLDYLTQSYKPVPDKLTVPAPKGPGV